MYNKVDIALWYRHATIILYHNIVHTVAIGTYNRSRYDATDLN